MSAQDEVPLQSPTPTDDTKVDQVDKREEKEEKEEETVDETELKEVAIDNKPVPSPPNPTAGLDPHYRWWVLASVIIAIILASSQSSALIIAFPDLMQGLDAGLMAIMFVLLAYMIVIAALVLPVGGISDVIGRKMVYNLGFGVFTIGCLLCGFARKRHNGWDLVAYRVFQGVGAACIFANSGALLTEAFLPWNQVGLAMGVFQVTAAVGSIIGPLIGGGLHDHYVWIFFLNVPLGAIGTAVAFWQIRDKHKTQTSDKPPILYQLQHLDWIGILMLIGGFVMFLLALTGEALSGLLTRTQSIALYVVGLCMLIFLVIWDTMFFTKKPVIQFKMFRASMFSISQFNGLLTAFGRGVVLFSAIFLFQGPFASSPFEAGVYTIPFGGGILISGLVSGKLADRSGPRKMQVIGPIFAGAGCLGIGFVKGSMTLAAPLLLLLLVGLGIGVYNSPNSMAGMLSVDKAYRGVASGFQTMVLMFGQILSLITLFGILTHKVDEVQLFNIFLYGGGGDNMGPVLEALHTCYFIATALMWGASAIHLVYNIVVPNYSLTPPPAVPPPSSPTPASPETKK